VRGRWWRGWGWDVWSRKERKERQQTWSRDESDQRVVGGGGGGGRQGGVKEAKRHFWGGVIWPDGPGGGADLVWGAKAMAGAIVAEVLAHLARTLHAHLLCGDGGGGALCGLKRGGVEMEPRASEVGRTFCRPVWKPKHVPGKNPKPAGCARPLSQFPTCLHTYGARTPACGQATGVRRGWYPAGVDTMFGDVYSNRSTSTSVEGEPSPLLAR